MQRKRNELIPVGEAVGGFGGPVKNAIQTSPQARHHFTQVDQVNQLVTAREADPDLGFMARLMALCSLPRTNPGNRKEYKRVNGPYRLYMQAGPENKLPYGNLPRLLLAWVSTEAVRTQSREIVLGRSLSGFMRKLDIYGTSGGSRGERTRLRNQMKRLFRCSVSLIYEDERRDVSASSQVADRTEFWWNERKPDEPVLFNSTIHLSEVFFNEIIHHPMPLNMNTLKAPQALLPGPGPLPVAGLPHLRTESPGADHLAAGVPPVRSRPHQSERAPHRSRLSPQGAPRTKEDQARLAGGLNYATAKGVLILSPSKPAVPPAQQLSLVRPPPSPARPGR